MAEFGVHQAQSFGHFSFVLQHHHCGEPYFQLVLAVVCHQQMAQVSVVVEAKIRLDITTLI